MRDSLCSADNFSVYDESFMESAEHGEWWLKGSAIANLNNNFVFRASRALVVLFTM